MEILPGKLDNLVRPWFKRAQPPASGVSPTHQSPCHEEDSARSVVRLVLIVNIVRQLVSRVVVKLLVDVHVVKLAGCRARGGHYCLVGIYHRAEPLT